MDVSTLYRLILPLALVCAAIQFAFWLRDRSRRAPLWWLSADLVGVLGGALMTLRGGAPEWVSIGVANTLVSAAGLLCWAGMRRSIGLDPGGRRLLPVSLALFVLFTGLQWWQDDLGLRVLTASLVLCVINAVTAWDLIQAGDPGNLRIRSLLAAVFAAHGLCYLFRAGTAMTLDAEGEFLRTGGLQAVTVLVATIKLVLWTAGSLVLLKRASPDASVLAT